MSFSFFAKLLKIIEYETSFIFNCMYDDHVFGIM